MYLEKSWTLTLHVCIASITKFCWLIETVRRVSLVYIIVTAVSIYGVDQSSWVFQVLGDIFTLDT